MTQKDLVALVLAIILALGATLMARMLFTKQSPSNIQPTAKIVVPEAETIEVLVATENLNVGVAIKASMISWQKWPKQGVLDSYLIRNDEDEEKYQKIIGGLLKRQINRGEPLTLKDIIKPGDHSFLSAIVRPGMRAMSLPLGNSSASSGLLAPGDMVDVISANMRSSQNESTSEGGGISGKTLAKNVKILAIDHRLNESSKSSPSSPVESTPQAKFITLEVSPEQAEILAMALKLGELTFSLRGLQTNEPEVSSSESLEKLKKQLKEQLGGPGVQTKTNHELQPVLVIRADKPTKVTFENKDALSIEKTVEVIGSALPSPPSIDSSLKDASAQGIRRND